MALASRIGGLSKVGKPKPPRSLPLEMKQDRGQTCASHLTAVKMDMLCDGDGDPPPTPPPNTCNGRFQLTLSGSPPSFHSILNIFWLALHLNESNFPLLASATSQRLGECPLPGGHGKKPSQPGCKPPPPRVQELAR